MEMHNMYWDTHHLLRFTSSFFQIHINYGDAQYVLGYTSSIEIHIIAIQIHINYGDAQYVLGYTSSVEIHIIVFRYTSSMDIYNMYWDTHHQSFLFPRPKQKTTSQNLPNTSYDYVKTRERERGRGQEQERHISSVEMRVYVCLWGHVGDLVCVVTTHSLWRAHSLLALALVRAHTHRGCQGKLK